MASDWYERYGRYKSLSARIADDLRREIAGASVIIKIAQEVNERGEGAGSCELGARINDIGIQMWITDGGGELPETVIANIVALLARKYREATGEGGAQATSDPTPYILHYYHYGAKHERSFAELEAALRFAEIEMLRGEIYPVAITQGDSCLYESERDRARNESSIPCQPEDRPANLDDAMEAAWEAWQNSEGET